jgi:hypothetical protein
MLNDIREDIRHLEQRMDARFENVEVRLNILDQKLDQRFAWLLGVQVMTLLAIVGTAAAILVR